jgi:two-component system, OmpR family, response regulator ChvI
MSRALNDPDDLESDELASILDLAGEISFLDDSMNCCVCFVDLVNSTKVTAGISDPRKIGKYYSIFINTMAVLVKNYGAKIVKNAGDALIFYFPETWNANNETAFKNVLDCLTTMILARNIINAKLLSENLPSVSYRISADYGRVEVATSTSSKSKDLFGSTMNICAKINSMAEPNGIVIGGDLHHVMQSFPFSSEYTFRELQGYSDGFNHKYPIYTPSNKRISQMDINSINELFRPHELVKTKDIQIKQQQQQQQQQISSQLLQKQHKKYSANIMVVDDESDIAFTYKSLLLAEGYNVDVFTDSQEALKHFVQLSDPSSYYQLVLLDIRMPRLNGLQLFYRIKAISPNTKIMFCSALDIAEELTSILPDITYNHILKKPLKGEYFINRINSMLGTGNKISLTLGA